MIQLCRHILPNGRACKGAAVNSTPFCRHHGVLKATVARCKPAPNFCGTKPIPFAFPEDRFAVQSNLFLVLQAFNNKRIDVRSATFMTYNLQTCMSNLGKTPLVEPDTENAVQRVILTPEGDEIAPPHELLEKGEDTPLHHKGCPCQRCAEEFRGAPPEQHHADCTCGMCEEDSPQSPSALTDQEQLSTNECHPEQSEELALNEVKGPAFPQFPEFPALSVVNKKEPTRSAPSRKLYDMPTIDPINRSYDVYDYLYGDALRKHEAQYAARARAAIEAGMEPPPHEIFDKTKVKRESESSRRHEAYLAEVEKNKKIGEEIWNRRFPHIKYEEPAPETLSS